MENLFVYAAALPTLWKKVNLGMWYADAMVIHSRLGCRGKAEVLVYQIFHHSADLLVASGDFLFAIGAHGGSAKKMIFRPFVQNCNMSHI